jgi:hypothetical protein
MGRSVSRESVEVRPGFSVDMTGQQRAFWSTLTSVPVGDQVSTEELSTKLDIEIRNLRVLKNKVGRLVSPAYIIKSKWGGFYSLVPVSDQAAESTPTVASESVSE